MERKKKNYSSHSWHHLCKIGFSDTDTCIQCSQNTPRCNQALHLHEALLDPDYCTAVLLAGLPHPTIFHLITDRFWLKTLLTLRFLAHYKFYTRSYIPRVSIIVSSVFLSHLCPCPGSVSSKLLSRFVQNKVITKKKKKKFLLGYWLLFTHFSPVLETDHFQINIFWSLLSHFTLTHGSLKHKNSRDVSLGTLLLAVCHIKHN